MPYARNADLPPEVRRLPKAAQDIFRAAFNAAFEEYGSEEAAFRVAWAAVKRKYRKEGDRWVAREAAEGGDAVGARLMEATKREQGYDWPASAFLVVPDPDRPSTWKLRIKELVDGEPRVTQAQLGRAAAALSPGGFRGNPVELTPEQRRAAVRKLRALYREHGWEPPESLQESEAGEVLGDVERLTEAVAKDGEAGKVFEVTLIRPGWSANGRYYPREVLAAAAPLYERARVFADHPTATELQQRPERSVRDLVAWVEGVQVAPDGSLRAELHLLESARPWLAPILRERPDLVGLSHHALGKTRIGQAEGRSGRVVEAIARVVSVDIVTEPAAGGSIDRLIASDRPDTDEGGEIVNWDELTLEALRQHRPDLVQALEAAAKQAVKTETDQALAPLREAVQAATKENAALRESLARMEARAIIAERVSASNLPAPAKARVRQMLEAAVPMKDGALDAQALETRITEAIKAEQDYLAQVAGSPVRGAGDSGAGSGDRTMEALKKAEAALDRLFGVPEPKNQNGGDK